MTTKAQTLVNQHQWSLASTEFLSEDIEQLRGYQVQYGNEKLLEFVASKVEFLSRRCNFFRDYINNQEG